MAPLRARQIHDRRRKSKKRRRHRTWLVSDERGSIVARSADSGTLLHINRYDEYGLPQSTNIGRFQYTGQMALEAGQDLYHYKARAYASRLGRFLQPDPLRYWDGPNLYAYVGNDPINLIDPLGTNIVVICRNCRQPQTPDTGSLADLFHSQGQAGFADYAQQYVGSFDVAVEEDCNPPSCYSVTAVRVAQATAIRRIPGPQRIIVDFLFPESLAPGTLPVPLHHKIDLDQTVDEVLKSRKGSVKRAPLPKGSPSWEDIRHLTMKQVLERKQVGMVGYRVFWKLLTEKERFGK